MITADCDSIRDSLDALVDGELRGDELRHVMHHVEACSLCADDVESRRALGGLIRQTVAPEYQWPVPAGLAAGVVARARAESYFSWTAALSRAVEDWHWVIVGGGAVGATCLSMLFCGALLLLGTAAPDADSISSLGRSLQDSPGSLYAEVSREGAEHEVMLVQLDATDAPPAPLPTVLRRSTEEREWVDALGETLAGGAAAPLTAMPEAERRYAEWLLEKIARGRRAEPSIGALGVLTVYRLHLVTNTDVTAKGLE